MFAFVVLTLFLFPAFFFLAVLFAFFCRPIVFAAVVVAIIMVATIFVVAMVTDVFDLVAPDLLRQLLVAGGGPGAVVVAGSIPVITLKEIVVAGNQHQVMGHVDADIKTEARRSQKQRRHLKGNSGETWQRRSRQARAERISAMGGDPFREMSVPQAVLKLRQGFGRLIRSRDDRGAVLILDNRIVTKNYGKRFLKSLPEAAQVIGTADEVFVRLERFFQSWH